MRWSQSFIPTLREAPANAQARSHNLLVRAGYIQQIITGAYSLLPLAQRVRSKIMNIVRQEMNSIGGQEFFLAALQPMELWEESGRREAVSDVMFRLKDRKGAEVALGLTHEEVFTSIARTSLISYKQLPQIWYQVQTKFRDEARPRGGLLRVREFTMKDSYSFDLDQEGLDRAFQAHREAYQKIFARCGLDSLSVDASSGAMGGDASTEFMIVCESGEDTIVNCPNCKYAANLEKAASAVAPGSAGFQPASKTAALPGSAGGSPASKLGTAAEADALANETITNTAAQSLEKFATPGIRTIKQLEEFEGGASGRNQIKTLVYWADGALVQALVEGVQELNEAKLQSLIGASVVRAATEDEIVGALGAAPGSLGACGVKSGTGEKIAKIVADNRLRGRTGMVTGANQNDFHYRGVSVERDIAVDAFADLHTVQNGEACAKCGSEMNLVSGLEIGHIFKLGTRYSESMNARVLLADGERKAILMGSYGIGIERLMAAVVEQNHDEFGIVWPLSVAPYAVVIVPINWNDETQRAAATNLYSELLKLGIDVIIDDREERAGVKFNDADLVGIPLRVTIGKKIDSGIVEFKRRSSRDKEDIPVAVISAHILRIVSETRYLDTPV